MANKMIKWFVFTVLLALLPIIIAYLFSFMTNISIEIYDFNNEILFFIIMVSSASLYDMIELINRGVKDHTITMVITGFILLIVGAAVIYGNIIYTTLTKTPLLFQQDRIFIVSSVMALVSFIASVPIQILLAKTYDLEEKSST